VGGGLLAVDLMETPDGYVVHEVNARMEFRNSIDPTGVAIHERVIDHLAAREAIARPYRLACSAPLDPPGLSCCA